VSVLIKDKCGGEGSQILLYSASLFHKNTLLLWYQ